MKEKFLKDYEEIMGVRLTKQNLLLGFLLTAGLFAALAISELF